MAYPENALTLDILPLSADTARLVRVYGTEPCIALPGTLPAPEGGSFAVTELGDYCFSEKPRSLPAADKTCRYEAVPDGTARLIRAFGQTVGGICRRYDFDWGIESVKQIVRKYNGEIDFKYDKDFFEVEIIISDNT